MRSNSVVLPAPLGPMIPRISPSWSWIDTSSTAVIPPNRWVMPRVSRTTRALAAVRVHRLGGRDRRSRPAACPWPLPRLRRLRHAAAPSRNTERRTSGRSSSSAVGPWKRISPFSMKYAVSAMVSATFTDCSTRMTVVPCSLELAHDGEQLLDDDWREPERQLVDHQHVGLGEERHREREHLLLAARQVRGGSFMPAPQHREELEHLLGRGLRVRAGRAGAATRATCRFSATVSDGNTPWPPGTWMTPFAAISCGGMPVMSLPSKMMLPRSGRDEARDRAQQRRLAGAVRAEQRDDLALADLEVDAEQHLHLAVRDVDRPQAEEVRRRRRSGRGRGS